MTVTEHLFIWLVLAPMLTAAGTGLLCWLSRSWHDAMDDEPEQQTENDYVD